MTPVEQGNRNPLNCLLNATNASTSLCSSTVLTFNSRSQNQEKASYQANLIYKLPTEIIAHMFKIYVDEIASSTNHIEAGVFTLGAVCRLWRYIAWSTPSLWSTLFFLFNDFTSKSKIELAIDWIGRSGKVPLIIWIFNLRSQRENESLILPLLDVINEALSRCRVLNLGWLTSAMLSRFVFVDRPPLLESLNLSICSTDMDTPLLLGAHASPKALEIDGVRLNLLDINWKNLTDFKARGLYFNEILDVFLLAPQLLECQQEGVRNSTSIPRGGYKPLTLLNLKRLYFFLNCAVDDGQSLSILLQQATFPNLKECELSSPHLFPTESFISFVSRSSCTIGTLRIMQTVIQGDGLINIARAMPSITSLAVSHWTAVQPSFDRFFTALCPSSVDTGLDSTSTNGCLLPLLRCLTVLSSSFCRWELVNELCNKRRHNRIGTQTTKSLAHTHAQAKLGFVAISRTVYKSDYMAVDHRLDGSTKGPRYLPSGLIGSWGLFLKLLKLKKDTKLILTVRDADNAQADLFEMSYRKLVRTRGQPPNHIRNNVSFIDWISDVDLLECDDSSESDEDGYDDEDDVNEDGNGSDNDNEEAEDDEDDEDDGGGGDDDDDDDDDDNEGDDEEDEEDDDEY